jgi:hypothetical protein
MNQDELLQQSLEALENGIPLEQVLEALPADQEELAQLLTLAVQSHNAAQNANINPLKAQSQEQRVLVTARQRVTDPVNRVTSTVGRITAADQRVTGTVGRVTKTGLPRSTWAILFAGAAVFAVFALISLVSLAFLFSTAASARAATLIKLSGVVEVAPANDATDWTPISEGEKIRAGMRLRTRADSNATLVFYDGSRTTLSPRTDLVLSQVSGGFTFLAGKGLQVRYQQLAGDTSHTVVPLKGGSSFFEVLTPAGKASVHGTIFDVAVSTDGTARFAVDRGVVEVSQSAGSVTLTAGQATLSGENNQPEPPSYQFFVQGPIQSIEGEVWTVNGLSFHVNPDQYPFLPYQVGDWVTVHGRILPDGTFQADKIDLSRNDQKKLRFTGVVESMGAETWTISGRAVLVNSETEIEDGILAGDPVEVNFTVLPDGNWLAREIERLDDEEEKTKTPTPTVVRSGTPETSETPEETVYPGPETDTPDGSATPEITPSPETTITLEGGRAGCETSDKQHPEGLKLAARWGVPYEEIMSWFCQGFGFGEIDLAYEMAQESGKPVAEIFAMKSSGMGWGQIKQELSPKPTNESKPTAEPKPTKETKPTKAPKSTKAPKN